VKSTCRSGQPKPDEENAAQTGGSQKIAGGAGSFGEGAQITECVVRV
jgi:hypothetical protein